MAYELATGVGQITRISTDANGVQGNGNTNLSAAGHGANWVTFPAFSPDGARVLFFSAASNLVPGDTNGKNDIFIKDLTTGAITCVSTDASGALGNDASNEFRFLPDGMHVAFSSDASNLVPGDTNGKRDIFIKDLATGGITRISTDSDGAQIDGYSTSFQFSSDATRVAFYASYADPSVSEFEISATSRLFIKDLVTGVVTLVADYTPATRYAFFGFSPDGTHFAYIKSTDFPGNTPPLLLMSSSRSLPPPH